MMKELNEKKIILASICLLLIGLGFNFLFPSSDEIKVKVPSTLKNYKLISIPEATASNAEWPEAREQDKGEMFDLFTPPEIFIDEDGNFVFRPPYQLVPVGPFGIQLVDIERDPYRLQLEGFVEEDRDDQSKTTILLYSVEDGKCLRLKPGASDKSYGFEILDWEVDRNFDDDSNTELIAWLRLQDNFTNRVVNLRHDQSLFEEDIKVVLKVEKTDEIHVLSSINSSFFVGDVKYSLEAINHKNQSVIVTKLVPKLDPVTEELFTSKQSGPKNNYDYESNKTSKSENIEEAFNSFF